MNLNQLILLIILWIVIPVSISAQSRNTGSISGKVMDPKGINPVEYANVLLIDTASGTMVTGIVTDSNGFFRLDKVPWGTYFVEYSFIGYEKQRSKAIMVDRKNPSVGLGVLNLKSSSINMDEVTVTGEKSMMITKIDRKVFNVQKEISAQTGTVTDLLQNIPSVSVDIDGNVSLRGSGSVTILVNGRPSVMIGAATLEQMPASLVERIEVITNPSAKYKPDGTAGIINIVLKKERKAGLNGSLGANMGNNDRYNTSLQINLNTGKINLFGSYGFRQDYRLRTGELYSQTIDTSSNQSIYLWQTSEGKSRPASHLAQLGIDWAMSNKDAAGISGTYNYRDVKRNEITKSLYKNDSLQPSEEFTRTMNGVESETSVGLTTFYEHTFNKEKENILRADFEYQGDTEKEDDDYITFYYLPEYPEENDQTHANNSEQTVNLALSYNRPLWKNATLEAGYEGNMQLTDQNRDVQYFDPDTGIWVPDPEQGNAFHSNQTVHALYTTISCGWKKFSMMGGLRGEEALVNLDFIKLDTTAKSDYFALYPTLHLALASGENEWQLNYSRRVNRPDGEDMNPVPEYRDPRRIFVGNPGLKPEDIHSMEFGYAIRLTNANLVPTLFYRYKVNGFTMVTTNVNDTVIKTTIDNLAKDQSAGIDFSGTWQIKKIVNLNFSASGFYSQIDASNIGYSSNKSTFSWNAKLNASINITKTTLFQANGQYRSEVLTAQGIRRPTWVVNLGFRQDFWKKKISFLFTVSDLFNSQIMKSSIETLVLMQESTRRRDARVIYGGVVFTFGTKLKKSKEPKFEFDNGMEQ